MYHSHCTKMHVVGVTEKFVLFRFALLMAQNASFGKKHIY